MSTVFVYLNEIKNDGKGFTVEIDEVILSQESIIRTDKHSETLVDPSTGAWANCNLVEGLGNIAKF